MLLATLFTAKPQSQSRWPSVFRGDGFRYYFTPKRSMLRLTDALFVAIGFAMGFPVIIPAAVIYLIARFIIVKDEHRRLLLMMINIGVLIGYIFAQLISM